MIASDGGAGAALLSRAHALRDEGDGAAAIRAYGEIACGPYPPTAIASAAIGLARLNSRHDAREAVRRLIDMGQRPPLATARAGEAAAAIGELMLARALADEALGHPGATPVAVRTALRVLEQSGEPSAALDVARRCGDAASVARIEGTLQSYDPHWRPGANGGARRRRAPRAGRIVTLLETSLPHVRSGYAYRSRTLLCAQREAGLDPVALTRLGFPANRRLTAQPVETVDGVAHHRAALPGVTHYTGVPMPEQLDANVRWAAALAEDLRPEAVAATTPHLNGLVGMALRERLGVPLAYDVRGFPEMTWSVRSGGADTEVFRLRREAETRCMREADLVTTLSETMRGHILARGIPAEKVVVVPHAVDVDAFAPGGDDESLAHELGLAGRMVVGYVSSLVAYEGVETLLDAIALARRDDPRIAGLIVGDGPLLASLRARAARLGLEGSVVFTGRVAADEVARYYAITDIFVCPRHDHQVTRYVTPLKPFEAMAAGCCVAVSDLPTLTELTREGECGATFPPGDARALAATVLALADDPEQHRALAAAAREHVCERHSLGRLRARVGEAWAQLTS